ncbi:hypothetical protein SAPIO_CDS4318 [Scedosporium apiospermum]|uniref:Heterokaryon incompatibility domain-containing protein n=1 Tax=Pseudallescheria apiosperma TaxID=563466 RepID=A0A084G8N6_PSEDA|nr:uncharacterized protein SAPIO_CDS4318 [Scedosporium apiospermum]KEZ43698.1 hypothetical protein SAPIO_CDS4318 [Scedosporium apiospermum]
MSSLESGVPIASLSRTYQKALRLTATLGVRYLWIDALCILQDSDEDWLQESPKMALPAIEGLARYCGERNCDMGTYVSGLWENSVHQGLLWILGQCPSQEVPKDPRGRPPAPTWSWGRWCGRIHYPRDLSSTSPVLRLVDDPPLQSPPFWEGNETLALEAPVCEPRGNTAVKLPRNIMFAHYPQNSTPLYYVPNDPLKVLILDNEERSKVALGNVLLAFVAKNEVKEYLYDDNHDTFLEKVTCRSYFLLLKPVASKPDHYRRIGLGWEFVTSTVNKRRRQRIFLS